MSESEMNILSDEDVVKMAQEGSCFAYEFLINKYRRTAKVRARRYYINGADNEDVIQEGMIGIFKAIRDFKPNCGAKFSTFLHHCVDRQIKTAIKGANRQKHRILNESISIFESGSEFNGKNAAQDESKIDFSNSMLSDKCENPETMTLIKETVNDIQSGDGKILSKLEKEVWTMMRQGMNYREIATCLGRSPKAIDNAMQRLKKKIRISLLDY